jgi:hypothetical protein
MLLLEPLMLLHAQDNPFATNTPSALPTNTPRPPSPIVQPPDAPIDNYALRLWNEPALVELLRAQVEAVVPSDTESQLAVQLIQYELERRYPGSPRSSEARAALLQSMLATPRGSVDMRAPAYAHMEAVFAAQSAVLDSPGTIEWSGWRFDWIPANIDNRPPLDALVHSVYPSTAPDSSSVAYEDYVPIANPVPGVYTVFPSDRPYPVAPLRDARSVALFNLGDVTGDQGQEMAVLVQSGELNQQLYLFGWRGASVTSLIAPGQQVEVSEIIEWGTGRFIARVGRIESARWGCVSEGLADWAYTANFFRLSEDGIAFARKPSLACTLYNTEPLFEQPLDEAINRVQNLYDLSEGDPAAGRAALGLAVLYALDNQIEAAQSLASSISDPDLLPQTNALMNALRRGDSLVEVCAAVVRAARSAELALCDIDAVLERLFTEQPLRRDLPIDEQLASLGIRVRERYTLRQVGRLEREAFGFDLAGPRWWAFAPLNQELYTAEAISPPTESEAAARTLRTVHPTEQAVAALVSGDLSATLVSLENAARERPDAPLSPAFLFVRALTRDFIGDREGARADYYRVWSEFPATRWGQLAAGHLERR